MIPKLIIQTGPPTLSLLLRAAVVNIKLLHPEFDYRFYDDAAIEKFLEDHFPEYKADYLSFRFRIQRYDFFRYLIIYRFGGFYLDTDMFLAHDLSPLLESECVFSFEELAAPVYFWKNLQMDWQIGNYAFGAEPGHPFMAAIIENCLRAKRTPTWVEPMMAGVPRLLRNDVYVLNTTGPGMVSRTLAENPQLAARITILFPDDVCDCSEWHRFGNYGVHAMAGSWRPRSNILGRFVVRQFTQWNLRKIIARSRTRGKSRTPRQIPQTEAHERPMT